MKIKIYKLSGCNLQYIKCAIPKSTISLQLYTDNLVKNIKEGVTRLPVQNNTLQCILGQFPLKLIVVSLSQGAIKQTQGNNNRLIDSYHSEVDYSLRHIKNIITQLTLYVISGVAM